MERGKVATLAADYEQAAAGAAVAADVGARLAIAQVQLDAAARDTELQQARCSSDTCQPL